MAARSGSKSESSTGSGGESKGGRATSRRRTTKASGTTGEAAPNGKSTANGSGRTAGRTGSESGAKASSASSTGRTRRRTSEASATGATARARIGSRSRKTASRSTATDMPMAEPTATVPADDEGMAAPTSYRAISRDMPRVAWLRTQLQQMEDRQRERLFKTVQLTLIAIVFITFVLQNADGVNVTFLLFSVNIRLIWVIFGCGLLGAAAGYLIGRPDKSLRALLPQKEKKPGRGTTRPTQL